MSSDSVAEDQIRSYFERWKRLEGEKDAISTDLRELFAEMKGNGFDTKVARKVFRDKEADPTERSEFEAIYDLYWVALSGPRAGRARERVEIAHTEPQPQAHSQAAQSQGNLSAPGASPDRREGDDDGQPIHDTQATTPLPEDQGQRAAVSVTQEHRPAEANGLVKEPSKAEGSGGVQDECAIHPAIPSQAKASTGNGATVPDTEPNGPADSMSGEASRPASGRSDAATSDDGRDSRERPATKIIEGMTEALAVARGEAEPAAIYTFTPKPHDGPYSSNGLPRPKGCQHVDACAGTWRARCPGCERDWQANSEPESAA